MENLLGKTRRTFKKTIIKPNFSKKSFNFNMIIGKGGFGKVWVVDLKKK